MTVVKPTKMHVHYEEHSEVSDPVELSKPNEKILISYIPGRRNHSTDSGGSGKSMYVLYNVALVSGKPKNTTTQDLSKLLLD